MKILYVTTVGGTMPFFKTFIKELIDMGHIVDLACNERDMPVADYFKEWGCRVFSLSCERSPFNHANLGAISEIKKLVERNQYDIVHCHTPIAAACTRIACRKIRRNGTKVFYTAHGFHFYKGASIWNWLLFFPVEWLCSWWTDILITINKEDYDLARRKLHANKVEYVPGVGVDLKRFRKTLVDKVDKRRELGIPEDAFLIVSVGELNANKNHEVIIRAISRINNDRMHYMIAGKGELEGYLRKLSKVCNVEHQVHLLGYRNDVAELYKVSDLFAFPSFREGLGLAAIEAMSCGLPLVTSNKHGINDYSEDGITGYKCEPSDVDGFEKAIKRIYKSDTIWNKMSECNKAKSQRYEIDNIIAQMKKIYNL